MNIISFSTSSRRHYRVLYLVSKPKAVVLPNGKIYSISYGCGGGVYQVQHIASVRRGLDPKEAAVSMGLLLAEKA